MERERENERERRKDGKEKKFFAVLGLELKAHTLSHSNSPFFVMVFFFFF
jgi:hypothetical protein